MFAFPGELHVVDRAVLTPTQFVDPCFTTDLSGQLGPNFFIQTNCDFNDAIYDESRDRIYASVPSKAGRNGNSIAKIDPQTGTIESYTFVGSEPTSMSLSANRASLFVSLSQASQVAVVDLQSQDSVSLIPLRFEGPFLNPQIPRRVAAAPATDTVVLVAAESEVGLYDTLGSAPTQGADSRRVIDLYQAADGQSAYGVNDANRLVQFSGR